MTAGTFQIKKMTKFVIFLVTNFARFNHFDKSG